MAEDQKTENQNEKMTRLFLIGLLLILPHSSQTMKNTFASILKTINLSFLVANQSSLRSVILIRALAVFPPFSWNMRGKLS